MLAVPLPPEIEARLDALAKAVGRSKGDVARDLIVEYLADIEDARIAEQRLNDLRAGRTDATPLDEVMRRYGMAD